MNGIIDDYIPVEIRNARLKARNFKRAFDRQQQLPTEVISPPPAPLHVLDYATPATTDDIADERTRRLNRLLHGIVDALFFGRP